MLPFSCRSVLPVPYPSLDPACGPRFASPIDPAPKPVRASDIGMVVFWTHKRERAEAILDAEGRWRCPRLPVLDRVLNALYEPRRDTAGDMPFGHAELIRVAAWLKGEVRTRHS